MDLKKKVLLFTASTVLGTSIAGGVAFAETIKVQKGDTLWSISVKHKTSVENLKEINSLSSNTIFVGQNLKITGTNEVEKIETPTYKPPVAEPSSPALNATYKVKRGDTLSKIGASYSVSYQKIKEWNNLKSDTIYIGQTLKIAAPNTSEETIPTPNPQPEPTPEKPIVPPPPPSTSTTYTVRSGDTLSKIGAAHNVSYLNIKEWNNLTSNLIFPGQKLIVSAAPPEPTDTTEKRAELVAFAKSFLGAPYLWAGQSPSGFDCSGFIYYVLGNHNLIKDRLSTAGYWAKVDKVDSPQPGDLVFFENTYKPGPSHMGIYLGDGEFIHAGDFGVAINKVEGIYWGDHFLGYGTFH